MRSLRTFLVSSFLVALGCNDGGSTPQIRIELVGPTGENAADRIVEGTLRVDVRQGDLTLACAEGACESPIRGGDFDLALPIESFDALTTIEAHISGGALPLQGAVPSFQVAGEFIETGEFPVRLVMMPRRVCAPLVLFNVSTPGSGSPRLVVPRRDVAAVVRRNVVLLAGGDEGGGVGSSRVDIFDQIVVEMRLPLDSVALGPSRGLELDEDNSLVVGSTAHVWRPQMGPAGSAPISVHDGAGFASALVRVGSEGAIVGGTDTHAITWLTSSGVVIEDGVQLSARRAFPAAAHGQGGALVMGGAPGGEWIERTARESVPVVGVVPEGSGGWLAASPTRRSFLWIGATGTETTLVTGCPACVVAPDHPTWDRARDGASGIRTAAGAFWIVGGDASDDIDLVLWEGETPRIVAGPALAVPRAGAALVEHAFGIVTVIGGQGGAAEGMLDSVELCMPDAPLDPI